MSPFQTVLFKIFFFWYKLMDAIFQILQEKKAILNKHENNYTSKVEKTFNS